MNDKFSSALFGEVPLFQVQLGKEYSPEKTEILLSPVRSDLGMIAHVFCKGCDRYFQVNEERYHVLAGAPPENGLHGQFLEVAGCSACTGHPKTGILKTVIIES